MDDMFLIAWPERVMTGEGIVYFYDCRLCGSLVKDMETHYAWHYPAGDPNV